MTDLKVKVVVEAQAAQARAEVQAMAAAQREMGATAKQAGAAAAAGLGQIDSAAESAAEATAAAAAGQRQLGSAAADAGQIGAVGLSILAAATERIAAESSTAAAAERLLGETARDAGGTGAAALAPLSVAAEAVAATTTAATAATQRLDQATRRHSEANAAGVSQARAVGAATQYTAWEMRSLSAQITDISVGLATGQSPFYILLQQGGQLKDAFGGVGGAIRAVLSTITPGKALVAGVAAGLYELVSAQLAVSAQTDALNNGMRATGGFAGQTAASVDNLAAKLAGPATGSIGATREALTQLVASGRVGSDALGSVANAALLLANVTGKSRDAVLDDFAQMSSGVTAWATKHNEQYHFLTLAQYDYIDALEKAGDKQGAMKAVAEALTQALASQAPVVTGLAGKWDQLKRAISDAIDSSRRGWGSAIDPTIDQQLAALEQKIGRTKLLLQNRGDGAGVDLNDSGMAVLRQQLEQQTSEYQRLLDLKSAGVGKAQADADKAAQQQRQIEAKQYVDRLAATYKAGADQLREAIAEFNRQADALKGTPDEISAAQRQQIVSGITKRLSPSSAGGTTPQDRIGNDQRALKSSLDSTLADLAAAAAAGTTTQADALAQMRAAWAQYFQVLMADISGELSKGGLSAQMRERLNSELDAARNDAKTKDAELQKQQTELTKAGEKERQQVILETLKAGGDAHAAALARIRQVYDEHLAKMRASNQADAQQLMDAWRQAQLAAEDMDALGRNVQSIGSRYKDKQVIAGAKVDAGVESRADARDEIAQAAQEATAKLQEARSQALRMLNDYPNDPKLAADLKAIDELLAEVGGQANQTFNRISDGIESGLAQTLEGIGTKIRSVGDLFRSLAQSISQTLMRVGSEELAHGVMDSIKGAVTSKGADGSNSLLDAARALMTSANKQEKAAGDASQSAGLFGQVSQFFSSAVASLAAAAAALVGGSAASSGSSVLGALGSLLQIGSGAAGGGGGGGGTASLGGSNPGGFNFGTGQGSIATAMGYATGGLVTGPGHDTSDNIPALLSPGEGVINARGMRMIGVATLNAINGGHLPQPRRFATGGYVGSSAMTIPARSGGGSGASAGGSIHIEQHIDARGADAQGMAALLAALPKFKSAMYAEIQAKLDRGIPLNG